MSNSVTIVFTLKGKVQGVGFRAYIRRLAADIGVEVTVHNEDDGSLVGEVSGNAAAVEAMMSLLWKGPRRAFVAKVEFERRGEQGIDLIDKRATELLALAHLGRLDATRATKRLRALRSAQDYVKLLSIIQESRKRFDAVIGRVIQDIGSKALKLFPEDRQSIRKVCLPGIRAHNVTHAVLSKGDRFEGLPYLSCFRTSVALRTRMSRVSGIKRPEFLVNNKLAAYKFVDLLGVRRPKVFGEPCPHKELEPMGGIVIKPAQGEATIGVFLVYSEREIYEPKRGVRLSSWGDMLARMETLLARKQVKRDAWLKEELILGDCVQQTPADDLKFLCFYGKVALVREIVRLPKTRDCWWTGEGKKVVTGQVLSKDGEILEGRGFTASQLELARRVSLAIPAPFMRIDFLRCGDELVFGEFTPRPGSFAKFDDETNRYLGDYYLDAEARLTRDLLNDKKFDEFREFVRSEHQGGQRENWRI